MENMALKYFPFIIVMLALLLSACSGDSPDQGASESVITVYKSPD